MGKKLALPSISQDEKRPPFNNLYYSYEVLASKKVGRDGKKITH